MYQEFTDRLAQVMADPREAILQEALAIANDDCWRNNGYYSTHKTFQFEGEWYQYDVIVRSGTLHLKIDKIGEIVIQ